MNGVPTCASAELMTDLARTDWNFDGFITGDCTATSTSFGPFLTRTLSCMPPRTRRFIYIYIYIYWFTLLVRSARTYRVLIGASPPPFFLGGGKSDDSRLSGGAAKDVFAAHKYGGSPAGAVAAAVMSGMDQDCGGYVAQHAKDAMACSKADCPLGPLTLAGLNAAVGRLFRLRLRLGYFDPPAVAPYNNASYRAVNYTANFEVALRAAREGIVLLDNHKAVLPFDKATIKSVAVIGPNADNPGNMQGVDCHGVPPYLITPTQGIGNFSAINFAAGCAIGGTSKSGFAAAVAAAKASDAVVLVMGLDPSIEYEMRDRTSLLLPGVQPDLVAAIVAAAPDKPVVLVVMSGGVVDVTPQLAAGVDAVIWVGYPGQSGGQALSEIVFGLVAPSGRTPLTWYPNALFADGSPDMINMLDMGMRPNASTKNPGRTYRFFPGKVLYEFGHGLAYTTFAITDLGVTAAVPVTAAAVDAAVGSEGRYTAPAMATASAKVCNTGITASDHSALFFAAPPTAGTAGDPIKSLSGFARTGILAPGACATVSAALTAWELSLAGPTGKRGARAGTWVVSIDTDGPSTTLAVA